MKVDATIINECWECSRIECPLRIEHGTDDYTYQYDFNRGICPIPKSCPLPDFKDGKIQEVKLER
jgi:hypothetical protein